MSKFSFPSFNQSRSSVQEIIKQSLEKVDVLITSGGVSMGEKDFIKDTIEEMGGKIHFGRVNLKPGFVKPEIF